MKCLIFEYLSTTFLLFYLLYSLFIVFYFLFVRFMIFCKKTTIWVRNAELISAYMTTNLNNEFGDAGFKCIAQSGVVTFVCSTLNPLI